MPRRTPIKRGRPPERFTPIRRVSPRQRARLAAWAVVTRQAIAAAGRRCQLNIPGVCTGRATVGHHRLPKSQGGTDTIENCVPACRACHRYAHDHPAWAYSAGAIDPRTTKGVTSC